MFADRQMSAALETMVQGIDVPPVALSAIQQKISRRKPALRHTTSQGRLALAAAAVIAVIVVAFPSNSLGVVQTIEARYRAALQAMGGLTPPPAPKSLVSSLSSQNASLPTAQSRVPFKIVPPAGLPNDIVSAKIQTTPSGVYSKITHSWRVGPTEVTFSYHRAGSRSFLLVGKPVRSTGRVPTEVYVRS
ncbi:MAG: hypothetical protein GIW98_02530 [Candidatus Eremiobacteraeota bacterium]|nr:hypothetical protein [Candidatus Eremiobacteraeota bacterium]